LDVTSFLANKAFVNGQTFTGNISAPNLSGTNTGDQTNITGNAGTVSNITASQVGSATAGLGLGTVGSYAILYNNSSSGVSAGNTQSGGSLQYCNTNGVNRQGSPEGTWRVMGTAQANTVTIAADATCLFLRIF